MELEAMLAEAEQKGWRVERQAVLEDVVPMWRLLEEAVTTTRHHVGLTLRAIVPDGFDDMSAKRTEHIVDVEMLVDAADPIDVSLRALTAVRTALPAADCATPGWEVAIERITAETRAAAGALPDA